MSKKKQVKKEEENQMLAQTVEVVEGVVEQVEEVKEEVKELETPKGPKQVIMEDFISFYNSTCRGKSHVSSEVGRQIVNYFNAYSDSKVIYTGCSSCVATKIAYMRKQAKSKYNLEF